MVAYYLKQLTQKFTLLTFLDNLPEYQISQPLAAAALS